MWPELHKYSAQFQSAVLNGVNAAGYPTSVRCTPTLMEAQASIHIGLANSLVITPGRASLLYHQHDEQLWDLKMFLVRGRLAYGSQGWIFYPEQLVPGSGMRHPIHNLATIWQMRRSARHYLSRRGLERPAIPWDEITALYPQEQS